MKALALTFALLASPALAQDIAGRFDYYVLSLSWSPRWCRAEGDARDADQCDPGRRNSFVVHGLWPQYESGWPSYCRTTARDPSRSDSAAMEDVMGSAGLAWYQWKKHGRCSGLAAADYYDTARRAFATITQPPVFGQMDRRLQLPVEVVEAAFLESNPGLSRDQITITCADGHIQEARICLTKDLQPRRCGPDVIRDCRMRDAVMEPPR